MNHSKLLNVHAKQVQRGGHTQDAKSLQGTVWVSRCEFESCFLGQDPPRISFPPQNHGSVSS
ncbi:hypothetical protein NC652_002897 [Populus alba x Populus x berolinensis]|nr:hypothetical protein NC652_002897 [Populus alba x Populus x berolinensis]